MENLDIKRDCCGDVFLPQFNQYIKDAGLAVRHSATDHLEQFIKNYISAFEEKPSVGDLNAALKFIELFLAEIMETHPKSFKAKAAGEISFLIGDAIETAENLQNL